MAGTAALLKSATSPRVRSRQDSVRARILASGAQLFVQKGYENVAVEDILAASDVARSSFYRFFAGREDVLSNLIRPVFEDGLARLDALVAGHASARATISGIFDTYLALWLAGPDSLRLSTRAGGIHFELFKDLHTPFRDRIRLLCERAAPSGCLLNGNADYSARLIARTAVPVLEVYHRDPRFASLYHKTMSGLLLAPENAT